VFRVKQWVDYHLKIGVDHFYLYYHGPLSDLKLMWPKEYDILMDYKENGIVTLVEWDVGTVSPWSEHTVGSVGGWGYPYAQKSMINHVCAQFGGDNIWMARLDFDQFYVLKNHKNIKEFLEDMDNKGVLLVHHISDKIANLDTSKIDLKQPKVRTIHKNVPKGLKRRSQQRVFMDFYSVLPRDYEYLEFDLSDFENYDTLIVEGELVNYIFNVQSLIGVLGEHDMIPVEELDSSGAVDCSLNDEIVSFHFNPHRWSERGQSSSIDVKEWKGKESPIVNNRIRELIREN
jgi:hypothetical protein